AMGCAAFCPDLCGMGWAGLHRAGLARASIRSTGRAANPADAGDRRAAGPVDRHTGGAAVSSASASPRPPPPSRVSPGWLAAAAVLSITLWLSVEIATNRLTHPRYAEMLMAARAMQTASRVLLAEKEARGLAQPPEIDPNRTGMIGAEFTPITTT